MKKVKHSFQFHFGGMAVKKGKTPFLSSFSSFFFSPFILFSFLLFSSLMYLSLIATIREARRDLLGQFAFSNLHPIPSSPPSDLHLLFQGK